MSSFLITGIRPTVNFLIWWGWRAEKQSVTQQAKILRCEAQMPRWQHSLERWQLASSKAKLCSYTLRGRVCNPVIIHLATSALWRTRYFALFGIPQCPSASVSKINRAIVPVKRLFFTGFTAIKVDMISGKNNAPKSSAAHVFILQTLQRSLNFFTRWLFLLGGASLASRLPSLTCFYNVPVGIVMFP